MLVIRSVRTAQDHSFTLRSLDFHPQTFKVMLYEIRHNDKGDYVTDKDYNSSTTAFGQPVSMLTHKRVPWYRDLIVHNIWN